MLGHGIRNLAQDPSRRGRTVDGDTPRRQARQGVPAHDDRPAGVEPSEDGVDRGHADPIVEAAPPSCPAFFPPPTGTTPCPAVTRDKSIRGPSCEYSPRIGAPTMNSGVSRSTTSKPP